MKRGDIVAFVNQKKVIHARVFEWNGNLESHVRVVDGRRNTYQVFHWECYSAGQFTRTGRILMTAKQAGYAARDTAFLDDPSEQKEFRDLFRARPTSTGVPGGRMVAVPPAQGFINKKGEHVMPAATKGGLERSDLPMTMVSKGLGYDHDAGTRYSPLLGMTMGGQLERFIEWSATFEPLEQHALELLEARSWKQADVWKRCVKGNWHGQTEKQVAVAKGWGVTPQAVYDLKRKALIFMLGYLPEDPRPYYPSFDPDRVA